MRHPESDLQIRCIKWFRYQYPAFARLMEHPKNEGNGNSHQGAIAKAEGVQPGVADLILHVPATFATSSADDDLPDIRDYCSLAVEMKTRTGRQSHEQKQWQRYFEAAGGKYVIVRSYDEFVEQVSGYMACVPTCIQDAVSRVHHDFLREKDEAASAQFKKLLNKQ